MMCNRENSLKIKQMIENTVDFVMQRYCIGFWVNICFFSLICKNSDLIVNKLQKK